MKQSPDWPFYCKPVVEFRRLSRRQDMRFDPQLLSSSGTAIGSELLQTATESSVPSPKSFAFQSAFFFNISLRYICRSHIVSNVSNRVESPGMPSTRYDAYKAAKPYFDLVRGALDDLVDG